MFKSTHPITRVFWISLVVGVAVYQLNKTEYPGSDAVMEEAVVYGEARPYHDINSCVFPAIFFETNGSELTHESMMALDDIGYRMQQNTGMRIEVAGTQAHSERNGLEISRENAIIKYLQSNHQVHPNRMVRAEESGEFVKPNKHVTEHHEVIIDNGHHYEFHYKSSCKSKSYTYSGRCTSNKFSNMEYRSCKSRSSKPVKKTHRAVFITCID